MAAPAAHASVADAPRGYELVSSPGVGARGLESIPFTGRWTTPITPSGRVLIKSNPALPGTLGETSRTLLVAERTADGWKRTTVAPASQSTFTHDGHTVLGASRELESVALELVGYPGMPGEPLEPGAIDTGAGSSYYYAFGWNAGSGSWLTRPQTLRDRAGDAQKGGYGLPNDLAYSENGATVVFTEPAKLTADIPSGLGVAQLYRRRGAEITAIGRRVDGTLALTGSRLLDLSASGDETLFTEENAPQPDLSTAADLLLTRAAAPTLLVNRSRRTGGGPRVGTTGINWARLTPDGSTALFTTGEQLTDADTDASIDLYRYRVADDSLELLSRGSGGAPGGNADDCSTIPGFFACDASPAMLSRDGRTAYFLAPEQLDGTSGDPAQSALYRSLEGGAPQFVASIASPDGWMTALNTVLSRSSYAVTNAGDLILETANPIGAAATGGVVQVWRYDASAANLSCLTCRQSGGAPAGSSTLSVQTGEGVIRGTKPFEAPDDGGSPRVTADGQTVFVNSYDRLVPEDVNAGSDVYAIDVASRTPHLVSTGRSPRDAYLVGIDADGSDAFFLTVDSLDPHDDNGSAMKLYDARIGGGFAPPPPPDDCRGAACRTTSPAPPASGNGSESATPDPAPPAETVEPDLTALSARDRSRIATTGRLTVKITGLRPGAIASVRVKVQVTSKRSVSAEATSKRGGAKRSVKLRFSTAERRRIASARRQRSLPVEVRLDHGADEPTILTSSIARVRKGR